MYCTTREESALSQDVESIYRFHAQIIACGGSHCGLIFEFHVTCYVNLLFVVWCIQHPSNFNGCRTQRRIQLAVKCLFNMVNLVKGRIKVL